MPSSEQQRDVLLAAATAEFAAKGFEATSAQGIASAAGVSKAKIFYYFDNKEELYARVLDRTLQPLLAPLESAPQASSAEAFWNSLEAGLNFAFEFSRDPQAAALVRDLYRRGGDSASLLRLLDRARAAIGNWLRNGRQLGAVRTDLPVPILAEAVVGALVHVDRWLAEQTDADGTTEGLLSSTSLAALAHDALQQRTPSECEAEVAYAAEDVPRETDAYLDVSATVMRRVTLRNGRHQKPAPSFEREGFEIIAAPTVFTQPPSDSEARMTYGAIELALKERLGASFAWVFDHTVRHTEHTPGRRPPIRITHADYGRGAGVRRLWELLSRGEAERWADSRIVMANLWQSVAGVVHSTPLGFIDITSVRNEDFIPVTVHYADRDGEIGYYRPNEDHRWYWFPFLRPSESLLFKTFDALPGEHHWSCPHAAFTAPNAPQELAGRRTSIEFRILLAFEHDSRGAA
ncbi:MAG: TetR/AcrR family transcriptional regulator [Leptolyngbya sp. SIO1E4]|nr:TetR/AcrR family transcriptional regulator [Leptolyngbya sp. SIO1E4]